MTARIPPILTLSLLVALPSILPAQEGGVSAAAETPLGSRPHLVVPRVPRPPVIDDFLDMRPPADLVGHLALAEDFIQQQPVDGAPSSQRTQVYTGYDDRNFYVVFLAHDTEPEKIRANLGNREQVRGDDIVEVQFDTYHDERRAFSFLTNPRGVQWDAIWTEGQGFDVSWDTVWQNESRLTEGGYVALFAIPFKSLRFEPGSGQTWGVVFVRDIPRNNEDTFWPRVSNRIEGRLNQAATLELGSTENLAKGRNIWLIPYATARRFRLTDDTGDFVRDSFDPDAGLDVKFVLRDRLTVDVTLNPDFSQVESDAAQVTVNERFEVFFPERRPFFLENADFFRTPFNAVFTRRIADPLAGGRVTGKLGPWSIGALLINDEAPGKVPDSPLPGERAKVGIFRLNRDVFEQSTVGVLYAQRDFGNESNRVGGVDGRFKLNANWVAPFQFLYSRTRSQDGLTSEDPAFTLAFNRSGRKVDVHLHYLDIGPDFRADVGFIRRVDIRDAHGDYTYTFWPEGKALISVSPGVFVGHIVDHQGLRLDDTFAPRVRFQFHRQTDFRLANFNGRVRLRPEDFPELTQPEDFGVRNVNFSASTWPVNAVRFGTFWSVGQGINFVPPVGVAPSSADELGGSVDVTVRPSAAVRLEGRWLYTRLTDPVDDERIFLNRISELRLAWQFNLRLSLRVILQNEKTDGDPLKTSLEDANRYNGDILLTYLVNPWTAIYLGTNSNYREIDPATPVSLTADRYLNDARQVFFKFTYLFRM